jgi:hypothetical protein
MAVPPTSEIEMWRAELAFIDTTSSRTRFAQFAIRTAVRAQAAAATTGADPIDELLDAWVNAAGDPIRRIHAAAIGYLRAGDILRSGVSSFTQP